MHAATQLNFHHLRYFWAVANEGNLTRVARRLRVSQSALSVQIRDLESELGAPLFEREGRTLALTETGRVVLAYADVVFGAGEQLVRTLSEGRDGADVVRVGAVSTLSRNFQESFLKPLLEDPDARLRVASGTHDELVLRLAAHDLDVVLSTRPASGDVARNVRSRLVARQRVSLVGRPGPVLRFPEDLRGREMVLPSPDNDLRTAFDAMCAQADVSVTVVAEVDDMALLRLLARDGRALTLLPSVVVRDELELGLLQEHCVLKGVYEHFYAIVAVRRFPHPRIASLLQRDAHDMLGMRGPVELEGE